MENISHSDFEHSITEEDYKPIKDVNDSYFGKVTILKNTRANQIAIKKQINISDLNTYHRLLEDYSFYLSLEHKNLVKVFGITANDHRSTSLSCSSSLTATKFPEICIYFEQLQNTLDSVLQKRRTSQNTTTQILSDKTNQNQKLAYFEESELFEIMLGLVDALEYLQQNSICHGDLRPSACFKSLESSTWKLFNRQLLSESNSPYQRAKERNTDVYLTPIAFDSIGKRQEEPIENKYKADIFALGMTLLECATLKRSAQIYDWNNFSINNKILTQRQEEVRQRYSPYFYEMVMHMIQLEEERRPDSIKLKELVEQRKLDLTAISNLVVEEEENFLKDLICKIDPKQTAFNQDESSIYQPFSAQKPFGANQQLSKIEKIDPESISIDEMSYRTKASLAADLAENANVQTFRNEDLTSSRNFLDKRCEANALLSKKIVVETFNGLPASGVHEYPDTDSGRNFSVPEQEEVKTSEKTSAESFQGNVTNQSQNSFKEPPKEFLLDTRNLHRTSGSLHTEMTIYEKALSIKEMMKGSIREPVVESFPKVQKEEETTDLHNHIQESLNENAPQMRFQAAPNEKIIEESELDDETDMFVSPVSSVAGSLGIMEKVSLPVFKDRFHLDLDNLLAAKKNQVAVKNDIAVQQAQIDKKDEVVSEVENLLIDEKEPHLVDMRPESRGEGSKSKSEQETRTVPRQIQTEPDTHNLNEKRSALLVKTMVQEALDKARRCREALKKSKEKYQNSRNYYLPNFKQNVKTSFYDDRSYSAAKKCVTEADQYDVRVDYDALLDKSSPYRQNPRLRNPLRNRHISASNNKPQGKQETMQTTPSQSYLHPSSLSKFDLSFNNSPIRSLATEPNFDVSRDASINLSSMFPKQQQHYSSIVKERSKSPTPVNVSAFTPVKQPFASEDQLVKSKTTLTPENTRMVNHFKEFIQSKVHKSGYGGEGMKRGISTENLKRYDTPSISTSLVVRDENKNVEDIKKSIIPPQTNPPIMTTLEGQKFDFEEQFQRAMEKAKMAQDYATKVRSTIDRTSEYPRSTSSERFGLKNFNY